MPASHPSGSLRPGLDHLWLRIGRPAVAAVAASAAGLIFIEVVVLVVWGADTGSSTSPGAALRVGADLWLVAHGATLRLSDGAIALRPLGLVPFPLLAALSAAHRQAGLSPWPGPRAARAPGRFADHAVQATNGDRAAVTSGAGRGGAARSASAGGGGAGGTGSPSGPGAGAAVGDPQEGVRRAAAPVPVPWRRIAVDVVEVVVAQTLFVVLVALAVRSGPARPTLLSAVLGTIVLALPAALVGALAGRHRLRTAWRRLPRWLRTPLACGTAAFASLIAAAAFGVALVIAATLPEVAGAERELDVGVLGGVGLAATQLALIPNLVVWALSYALGPGFHVGSGLVRADMVHVTRAPDLPVLASLPPSALPRVGWPLLLLVPLVAGAVSAMMMHRATAGWRSRDRLGTVLLAGLVCGLLCGLAGSESGGQVGGAGQYGPAAAWVCGLLAGGEIALVGLVLVGGIDLAVRRAERPFLARDAEPSFWRRRLAPVRSRPATWTSRRPD
ncbi:Integral membrane protein [Frankia sp. AiPs1]|uniref:cell division protein PerM n=1 Tax=Frankia sp. AiPa1 TaxID=573492 RepID=UPI00202B652F|nr:DUF6350 family protein [Frankia sp. AiPa1]MCL9757746.1 DUF6350 family protein [Frankia sp. AiPa1]